MNLISPIFLMKTAAVSMIVIATAALTKKLNNLAQLKRLSYKLYEGCFFAVQKTEKKKIC